MRALEGWRIDRRRDPVELAITTPDGRGAATVRPAGPKWDGVWRRVGIGERMVESEAKAWREAGGRVPIHRWVDVELAGGTTFRVRNGAPKGPKRSAGDAKVEVQGRTYSYRHTSPSSAEVWRDDDRIAQASTGGRKRPEGSTRADFGLGLYLAFDGPLDHIDEVMVVLFADLFGPPGRDGVVRRVYEGLKWELNNP